MFLVFFFIAFTGAQGGTAPFVMPTCPNGKLPMLRLGDVVNCDAEKDDCPQGYACTMIEHYTGCCAEDKTDTVDVRRRPPALRTTLITRQPNNTQIVRELFLSPETLPDNWFTRSLRERPTAAPQTVDRDDSSELERSSSESGSQATAARPKSTEFPRERTVSASAERSPRLNGRMFANDGGATHRDDEPPSPTPTLETIELPDLTPSRWHKLTTFPPGPGRGLRVISFTEDVRGHHTTPPEEPKPEITGIRRLVTPPSDITTTTTPPLIVLTPKRWRTLTPPQPWTRATTEATPEVGTTPKLLVLTPKRWGAETTVPWVKHTTNVFVPPDILNGIFIPGIRRKEPSGGNAVPSCDKQPFKASCSDGSKSQYTLRWYLKDGMCCSYPYGHCKGDEIAKESALRTRADCELLCSADGSRPSIDSQGGNGTDGSPGGQGQSSSSEIPGVGEGDPGTKPVPDEGEFTCSKQPYKQVCSNGRRSQYTIRWYVKNGMCCSYPWGHCKGDEIAKETVIRTKAQCEKLCLGNR